MDYQRLNAIRGLWSAHSSQLTNLLLWTAFRIGHRVTGTAVNIR